MGDVYDVIVIGAGIEGSATAYTSQLRRHRTLLLEQFALPHTRGSSHGQSRIIRKAYEQQHYAQMMGEAYDKWFQLERDTNLELFKKTGLLVLGLEGSGFVTKNIQSLKNIGSQYEYISSTQLRSKFPLLDVPGFEGVYDGESGILLANRCLKAYQTQFVTLGGRLEDETVVKEIIPGPIVTVNTNKGAFKAKSVIITAGPWTSKLVAHIGLHLPLKPVRVEVGYWKHNNQGFTLQGGFPNTIIETAVGHHLYSLPAYEYQGHLKMACHYGQEIDPDHRDAVNESTLGELGKFIKQHVPGVESKPSIVETCIYTNTLDEDFILDTHPHWKNIVIGAGFSGHGFKLAPIVGKLLTDLATNSTPSYDMAPFKISRFFTKAKL